MTKNPNLDAGLIITRREILDWRDKHRVDAELILRRTCLDLHHVVDARLNDISLRDALIKSNSFCTKNIDPIVIEYVQPVADKIIIKAQHDLGEIIEHQISSEIQTESDGAGRSDYWHAVGSLAAGIAPLAGGAAVAVSLPTLTIGSTAVVFGLFASATVSIPLLIAGAFGTGALLATGAYKTSKIKQYRIDRIRKRIHASIDANVLAPQHEDQPPSVLTQFDTLIQNTSENLIRKIDNGE